MRNDYYYKNYRRTIPVTYCPCCKVYQSHSDSLYDASKGVSIYYLNVGADGHPVYRTLYDAELANSSSPAVTAIVPPQVQANLRLGLSSMPKSGISSVVPVSQSLDAHERTELAKVLLAKGADMSKANPAPPTPPTPSDGDS